MDQPTSQTQHLTQTSSDLSASTGYPVSLETATNAQHDVANTAAAALLSTPPVLNQASQPQFNNTVAPRRPPARKRKPAAPGSRGVSTLTPEQLAKKRANDRDAQRAIRERTKNTIEGLEQRIRDLESQQPFQELQRAIAERDKALTECEELRQRLAAVAGIVGNRTVGQAGLNELAALTAQQAPLAAPNEQEQYSRYDLSDVQTHHDQPTPTSPRQAVDVTSYPQQHLDPNLRSLPTVHDDKEVSPS